MLPGRPLEELAGYGELVSHCEMTQMFSETLVVDLDGIFCLEHPAEAIG